MNISGIRPYAGFYDYNTIKSQEAHSRQIAEAKAEASVAESQKEVPQQVEAAREVAAVAKPAIPPT